MTGFRVKPGMIKMGNLTFYEVIKIRRGKKKVTAFDVQGRVRPIIGWVAQSETQQTMVGTVFL